jgi:hypothetical protein
MVTKQASKRPAKRIVPKEDVQTSYCRKCMQTKDVREFYQAVDKFLDANGYMSVCKVCCEDIYQKSYAAEKDIPSAILKTCRSLNIVYMQSAVNGVLTSLAKNGKTGVFDDRVFGLYKKTIRSNDETVPKTFIEPGTSVAQEPLGDSPEYYDLKEFWGDGFSFNDYQFLEKELANFKKTHRADTHAEVVLMKEVCFKMLEISKARIEGKSVDVAVKALQEIMKSLNISPNLSSASSSGKSMETFGVFIKQIEETEPAEYYADKELFRDFDGLDGYIKNYIVRALKNFVTGSKDFEIQEEDFGDDDFEQLEFNPNKDEEDANIASQLQ